MQVLRAALLVVLAGCAAGPSGAAGLPVPVGGSRPEDRVVLSDFSQVNAIAASFERVFVVYSTGLGIWRPIERRWEAPRNAPDATLLRGVVGAIIDPLDQSLWLASRNIWLHYYPDINQWDRGSLPADAIGIAVESSGQSRGIWFRTRVGWLLLPRGSALASPAAPPGTLKVPPTIDDAMRANPAIRGRTLEMLTGTRFANGAFTSVAASADGRGWFLGTNNHGVIWFDNAAGQPEYLTLGLSGELVGALAVTSNGVWVATDRDANQLPSVALVAADLSGTQEIRGSLATGLPFGAVRAILPDGPFLWLGTDQGVVRVDIATGAMQRWSEALGLPDSRVLALAKVGNTIAVGTMRGLVEIAPDGKTTRRDRDYVGPIYALHAGDSVLWIGSDDGILAIRPTDEVLQRPRGLDTEVPLRTRILGIGQVGDTVVAMTSERILWREPNGNFWHAGPVVSSSLGVLAAFFADDRAIWMGGEHGLGVSRPTSPMQRQLTVPGDLPNSISAIAVSGSWLWVGTRAGLVRFRLSR